VASHAPTPTPAAAHRQSAGQAAPVATDAPSTASNTPESVTGADSSPDAAALVWDLTVHRLHQAFAECLATRPDTTPGGPTLPTPWTPLSGTGLDGVRLAATCHAVNDIQDALRRMAAGSYGPCQRCDQPIGAQRLRAAPTSRWCPTCHADRCG
jgi:hypothetical protein